MLGRWMKVLESMWTGVIVTKFGVSSKHFSQKITKLQTLRIANIWADIWQGDFLIMQQKCCSPDRDVVLKHEDDLFN
jgi:hypothetical protein